MKPIVYVAVISVLVSGCSIIGSGNSEHALDATDSQCKLQVENAGSFWNGHHIHGTWRTPNLSQLPNGITDFLQMEGYSIQSSESDNVAHGIFHSNGKPYHMIASLRHHQEMQIKLEFITPRLIGLRSSDVQKEFCRLLNHAGVTREEPGVN